jgi:DNA-binding transcriptional regulator LsrR (DeoR family)
VNGKELMAQMDEIRLMVKIARMYYQQDMTQAHIASRVGLSRQKIQRLLKRSRETGVVHILIKPAIGAFAEMERRIEDRYGLRDAVVAETVAYESPPVVTQEVAAAAAEYLCRVFRSHDRIAVSWGSHVRQTVSALYHHPRPNVKDVAVIQGFGGIGDANDEEHVTFLTQQLAAWLGAPGYIMPAPALAGSSQARRAFCKDPSVSHVLEKARKATLLVTGIGTPAAATRLLKGFGLAHPELAGMPIDRAAGDISLRFFDCQGRAISCDFDERVVGLTLREFHKIGMVVGVAGGAGKLHAIAAALRGGHVNVLVTDHVTAARLLE